LIKGLKDSDSSLVSNENFGKILWPNGWALGQVTWAKMAQKLLHLWRYSQTICRLADPFESLNSSLVQSEEELWHW